MKTCTKCGLPETYETIEFENDGACNICHQQTFRNDEVDWDYRKSLLKDLIKDYKGKYRYDCIVPFSGGKDSTFTLHYLVNELGLKPLVVQFDHGFMRPNLLKNNERIFKQLGVDVHSFTPNWKLVKRLMLESLIRKGDFCWFCHTGIFSYPMHVAIQQKVPLIFWGEPSAEYTAYYDYRDDEIENVDENRFNRFVNLGITADDMIGMIDHDFDVSPRDMLPFTYPPLRDLKKLQYRSVCLGSYIKWDVRQQSKLIMEKLNWKGDQVEGMPWDKYPYEKIECYMQGVRDYIKYLKRGYSRVSQMTALDLRNGRISKKDADRLVSDYEGKRPPSLDLFLEYLEISEDEFNQIILKTVVPPFQPDFKNIKEAPKTWDYDKWHRDKK